ncbi:MAG: protein translocase subunit SecF [Candidatus Binatia bacterium]
MLEIIRPDTKFDFLGVRRWAVGVSLFVIAASFASVMVRGLNYGIDFAGGTMVHLRFPKPVEIGDIRAALGDAGAGDVTVQDFGGSSNEFMVRMPESDPELKKGLAKRISSALSGRFGGEGAFEVLRVESVGPRVGSELRRRAFLAVTAATLMMGLYIALRFDIRFGIGAAAALIHDVIVTVGALSLFGYEFDLNIVAALLTIVGFSVNDTVIISDRVRENMRKSRREAVEAIFNRSINETLSRTILTTGTALFVILALYVLGGEIIRGFAFALLVGFIAGTYSTVFIAGAVVLAMEPRHRSTSARAA